MRTQVHGTVVHADVAAEDLRVPASATIRASHPFYLVHYYNWDFVSDKHTTTGGEWLPELQTVRATPGANGVGIGADGKAKHAALLAGHANKGGIVILRGDRRMGKYADYLKAIPIKGSTRGNVSHVLIGASAVILSGGRSSAAVRDMDVLYNTRRQAYIGSIVPEMTPEQLEDQIRIIENRTKEATEKVANGRMDRLAYTEFVKENDAKVKAMELAFRRQFSGAPVDGHVVEAGPALADDDPSDVESLGTQIEIVAEAPKRPSKKSN